MIEPYSFEYYFFLAITIAILSVTFIVALILGRKMLSKRKKTGKFSFDFIFAMFILLLAWFFSRFFYLIFDFILTQFDSDTYILMPNILFYKLGDISASIGIFTVLYVIDKDLLNFKMKRIPEILVIIISLLELFYPVNTKADFEVVSLLGYVGIVFVMFIFLLFLYVGKKTPSLRKYAYMISIGIILIGIGSVVASFASIIIELVSILYTIVFITLVSGIVIMGYGVLNFNI